MLATELTNERRRDVARRHLETAELWLRKIIQHEFSVAYGQNYFSHRFADGVSLINGEIRKYVTERRTSEPLRYSRDIDATTLGEVIRIVTNTRYFDQHFKQALKGAYPDGEAEARTFLTRLKIIRDKIAHGSSCSARELEQAVCYTNDFIESVKDYFAEIDVHREYNVPTITRFVDSLGNESHMEDVPKDVSTRIIDWRVKGVGDLHPGEQLRLEIEIDESFNPAEYTIEWSFGRRGRVGEGPELALKIGVGDVGVQVECRIVVTSNRDWHKFGWCDDSFCVIYRELPPL